MKEQSNNQITKKSEIVKNHMEPEILKRGKAFHKRVQKDWEKTAEGKINSEHVIKLTLVPGRNKIN